MADGYSRKEPFQDRVTDRDEDPLMALARIVGFEQEPAPGDMGSDDGERAALRFQQELAREPMPSAAPTADLFSVRSEQPRQVTDIFDLEAALLAELGEAPAVPVPFDDDATMPPSEQADSLELAPEGEVLDTFAEAGLDLADEVEFPPAADRQAEFEVEPEEPSAPAPVSLAADLEMMLLGGFSAPLAYAAAAGSAELASTAKDAEPDVAFATTNNPEPEFDLPRFDAADFPAEPDDALDRRGLIQPTQTADQYRSEPDEEQGDPWALADAVPVETQIFDGGLADFELDDADWEISEPIVAPLDETADTVNPALIDQEFEAALAEELDDFDFSTTPEHEPQQPVPVVSEQGPAIDPVEELAAIMGVALPGRPNMSQTDVADEQQVVKPDAEDDAQLDDDIDRMMDEAFAPDLEVPSLDLVDMSDFEPSNGANFPIPDLERLVLADQSAPGPVWDQSLAQGGNTWDNAEWNDGPRDGVTAATAPGTLQTSQPVPDMFDEVSFEEELARDMEFVRHDIDALKAAGDLPSEDGNGNADPFVGNDDNFGERPARKGLIVAAVVGCVAILGAVGVFALSGGNDKASSGPVIVAADTDPIKLPPETTAQAVHNQDRALFADSEGEAPAQPNLATAAEEPIDITSVPAESLPSAVVEGEKAEDRLIEGGTETAGAPAAEEPLIAPRRVRTLVVRPDGTLAERAPDPVPVAETQVAAVAPAPPAAAEPVAPVVTPSAADQAPAPVAFTPPTGEATVAVAPEAAPAVEAAPAPVAVREVRTQPFTPPVIRDRPANQPVNIINPQPSVAVAAAQPAPTPAVRDLVAAPTASAPSLAATPYSVQIASLPSEDEARRSAANLTRRYASVIDNRPVSVQRAVIEGRGTFYRVRIGAGSNGEATAVCNAIKASGGNCFVTR